MRARTTGYVSLTTTATGHAERRRHEPRPTRDGHTADGPTATEQTSGSPLHGGDGGSIATTPRRDSKRTALPVCPFSTAGLAT